MGEEKSGRQQVTYTLRLGEQEQRIVEKALEGFVEELGSQKGLEGGKGLLATLNRFFDQQAFKSEAETRNIETSTALLKKIAEGQEQERKSKAALLSTIQTLDRRIKELENGQSTAQQRVPFRDSKTRPHPQRNQKAGGSITPPAAPKTSEVPQRAKNENEAMNNKNEQQKEVAEKFSNTTLKDQVAKFAVQQAGPS